MIRIMLVVALLTAITGAVVASAQGQGQQGKPPEPGEVARFEDESEAIIVTRNGPDLEAVVVTDNARRPVDPDKLGGVLTKARDIERQQTAVDLVASIQANTSIDPDVKAAILFLLGE